MSYKWVFLYRISEFISYKWVFISYKWGFLLGYLLRIVYDNFSGILIDNEIFCSIFNRKLNNLVSRHSDIMYSANLISILSKLESNL